MPKPGEPDGTEAEEPWLVGLRDRALIGLMVYTFARISVVVAMQVEDYFLNGKHWWVRQHEKGGERDGTARPAQLFCPNARYIAHPECDSLLFVAVLHRAQQTGRQ